MNLECLQTEYQFRISGLENITYSNFHNFKREIELHSNGVLFTQITLGKTNVFHYKPEHLPTIAEFEIVGEIRFISKDIEIKDAEKMMSLIRQFIETSNNPMLIKNNNIFVKITQYNVNGNYLYSGFSNLWNNYLYCCVIGDQNRAELFQSKAISYFNENIVGSSINSMRDIIITKEIYR